MQTKGQGNEGKWSDYQVDLAISHILRAGLISACILAAIGGVLYLSQHANDMPQLRVFHEDSSLHTVGGTIRAALSLRGDAIMQLGVLLLLFTPIMRVAFACYAFFRQRDAIYVCISAFVLALLMFSLLGRH